MEPYGIKNKKEVSLLELAFFIFTMIFFVQFNDIDLRIIICFFWIIKSIIFAKGHVLLNKKITRYYLFFLVIISYSLIVLYLNGNYNFFISFRYIRAVLTFTTIFIYLSVHRISPRSLINASLIVFSIHSSVILLQILFPNVEQYTSLINGYSKKALELRGNGLVSGYDFAGTYLNIAIFIAIISYIKTSKKIYFLLSAFFIVGVFMTSRVSIIVTVVLLILLVFIALKNGKKLLSLFLIGTLSLVSFGVVIFLVLSMDIMPGVRNFILQLFPFLYDTYADMVHSYANYEIKDTIMSQVGFPYETKYIFGIAEKAPTDPGYLHTIYSIGYVGLLVVYSFYVYIFIKCLRNIKQTFLLKQNVYLEIINYSTAIIALLTITMEIKLSFMFSTGMFELMIIFFLVNIINKERILQ
ncbi:hypothetical protein [Aquibacillus saliphilus]|uniref:hypothetical protein n=1 Tax=Aquibacillus saliphilus TaxID=1909422 RepID=UPI001CF0B041|nr:hypothetical protein [Aquibacillus saliphilus]